MLLIFFALAPFIWKTGNVLGDNSFGNIKPYILGSRFVPPNFDLVKSIHVSGCVVLKRIRRISLCVLIIIIINNKIIIRRKMIYQRIMKTQNDDIGFSWNNVLHVKPEYCPGPTRIYRFWPFFIKVKRYVARGFHSFRQQ